MNEKEFIKFIQNNKGIINKVSNIYSRTNEDFEDLQQEIILQVWKSIPKFNSQSKVSTWLYKIALNTALNIKRKKRIVPIDIELNDRNLKYTASKDRFEEEIKWLYKAIQQLNDIEKAIILLYLEEKSYNEISDITGFPKEQIGVKLSRAKTKLQKTLNSVFNNKND